ncbi:hypothetical protein KPL71_017417 [Citrus sinensis]|uniref:Uncharacterized protein n=1 Tax=Citrus sinensis TaxID=2711 RepID=A0ACB8JPU5_CITSI|nr:hypothetical protein KPL71_017417 [Citrus sinensis]
MTSGEAWRDAWRTANNGFEQLVFEAKKTAERIDRQYSVSRRLNSAARTAAVRARELDREFAISVRWRSFRMDFSRNWPRTIFFLWFALSGWLFRILILATWVLPIAAPLLIGTVANNFVIKGACPACKREFIGSKSQIIRCAGCGNIVWQPEGDFFSRNGGGKKSTKSDDDIIDVDFEEK